MASCQNIANLSPDEYEKYEQSLKILNMYTIQDADRAWYKELAEKDKEIERLKRMLGLKDTKKRRTTRTTKAKSK